MARITDSLISAFVKATTYKQKKPSESYVFGVARNKPDGSIEVKINGTESYVGMRSGVKVKDGDKVAVMIKNRTPLVTNNLTTPSVNNSSITADGFLTAQSAYSAGFISSTSGTETETEEVLSGQGEGGGTTGNTYTVSVMKIFNNPAPRVVEIGDSSNAETGTKVRSAIFEYRYAYSISDRHLKFHIIDTKEDKALEKINLIKHRQFKWRADGKQVDLGYIAQELGEIDPNLEIRGKNCAVNISYLIPLMSKAIQELSAEVDKLKGEINELKHNSVSTEE